MATQLSHPVFQYWVSHLLTHLILSAHLMLLFSSPTNQPNWLIWPFCLLLEYPMHSLRGGVHVMDVISIFVNNYFIKHTPDQSSFNYIYVLCHMIKCTTLDMCVFCSCKQLVLTIVLCYFCSIIMSQDTLNSIAAHCWLCIHV